VRPAFAPWVGEIVFDWPIPNNDNAYRFWLNHLRLHSLTSVVSGGETLTSLALPWPSNGPVYTALDIDTAGSSSLDFVSGTGQRSLTIAGTWGTIGDDRARASWTLGASASESADTLTVNAPAGIGSLLLLGSERVMVTGRSWVDSGQTASALTSNKADQSITVATGSAFFAGEQIIIDSERLFVRDVVGNTLIVQRAADGSTLAAHSLAAPIYWARSCVVERAMLGTTASAHSSGDIVSIYRAPSIVEQLAIAYAVDRNAQENVGYARNMDHIVDRRTLAAKKVGGAVGATGIAALEARVIEAYGRIRTRAV